MPDPAASSPLVVIAEVGCNHKGDLDIALEMIKVAAQFSKVDVVKFHFDNPPNDVGRCLMTDVVITPDVLRSLEDQHDAARVRHPR